MSEQFVLTPEVAAELDQKVPSPRARADEIFAAIKPLDLGVYDLNCFCVEWLASQYNDSEFLLPTLKEFIKRFYYGHYYYASTVEGNSTREGSSIQSASGPIPESSHEQEERTAE